MARTKNMGKSQKQTRKSSKLNNKKNLLPTIIPIIILSILLIIIILFLINNILLIDKYTKDNKLLHTSLDKIKDNNVKIKEELTKLDKEYNDYIIIDESIKKTKDEVFKLAKDAEKKINSNESNYKIAYLTFDDGPYYLTDKVLKILKDKAVKATFFTIGLDKDICYDNKNKSCFNTYKKIVDNNHTIANHTYSHAIFRGLYSSSNNFITQVKLQQDLIEKRTGIKTNILRFPGGSATANALAKSEVNNIKSKLKEMGYGWVDWTAQDGDGGYLPNYDTAWSNFTKSINEPIEVVLFHDYSEITASMLPNAIDYLEERNYILLPLFYESIKVNK